MIEKKEPWKPTYPPPKVAAKPKPAPAKPKREDARKSKAG